MYPEIISTRTGSRVSAWVSVWRFVMVLFSPEPPHIPIALLLPLLHLEISSSVFRNAKHVVRALDQRYGCARTDRLILSTGILVSQQYSLNEVN